MCMHGYPGVYDNVRAFLHQEREKLLVGALDVVSLELGEEKGCLPAQAQPPPWVCGRTKTRSGNFPRCAWCGTCGKRTSRGSEESEERHHRSGMSGQALMISRPVHRCRASSRHVAGREPALCQDNSVDFTAVCAGCEPRQFAVSQKARQGSDAVGAAQVRIGQPIFEECHWVENALGPCSGECRPLRGHARPRSLIGGSAFGRRPQHQARVHGCNGRRTLAGPPSIRSQDDQYAGSLLQRAG